MTTMMMIYFGDDKWDYGDHGDHGDDSANRIHCALVLFRVIFYIFFKLIVLNFIRLYFTICFKITRVHL